MKLTANALARKRRRFWPLAGLFQLTIALLVAGTLFSASWGAPRAGSSRGLAAPEPRAFLPLIEGPPLGPILDHDWQFAAQQLAAMIHTLPTTSYPTTTNSQGQWQTTSAGSWISGFFPGSLWFMYERTSDTAWRGNAQAWQAGIESQKFTTTTHDLGFMIFNSFGNGYRLTGDEAYRQVVLTAAGSLATRYSPVVGCIRSLDGRPDEFKVIIDNMMNLELLFWASKHGGKPEWYDIAVSHALKTRQEHVRADGSTYHQIIYDPATGAVRKKGTVQGYRDDTTWARGQAWAIYGFTMTYRETNDSRFLETARKTADYFLSNLPPDHVPYWDFQAPAIPNEPRDSSAAAIAASGLLELSQLEPDAARKQSYLSGALAILVALSTPAYLAEGTTTRAILLHGTNYKPGGDYDTGLIWGDYYFLEGLLRAQRLSSGKYAR
jgi:unsaturated chondroitin disaccharide hydrolase